jgi:D-alanyl-D-alanine dipeptidase
MSRVVDDAVGTGLAGVIVAPGPDLVWLTGYQPTAITERLTDAGRRFNNTGHHLHVVQ